MAFSPQTICPAKVDGNAAMYSAKANLCTVAGENCGLDDTCVFCTKCFHATDHDGHDVFFSVSPGSGGCCDCGDPEAWKVPLQCKIHSLNVAAATAIAEQNSGRALVEPELIQNIRRTVATVLNFLLDTFALAPEEVVLPASAEDLMKENKEQCNILKRMGIPSHLPSVNRGASHLNQDMMMEGEDHLDTEVSMEVDVDMDKENSESHAGNSGGSGRDYGKGEQSEDSDELYVCIAWNDEGHAFSHVLESIISATNCDWEKAKQIVDVIQVHGREIIAESTNIEHLRKIAAPLASINLGVTIRPARDTFREQVAGLLVDWLKELVNGQARFFNDINDGDSVIRTILCEELCAEWELRLPLALLTTGIRTGRIITDDVDDEEEEMKDDVATMNSDAAEDVEMFDPDSSSTSRQIKIGSPGSSDSSPIIYRNQRDVASIDWNPAAMVREYQRLREDEEEIGDNMTTKSSQKKSANKTSAGKKAASSVKDTQSPMSISKEFEEKLRLDYFMLYDLKLWKEVRISLRELYIASLASNAVFKKALGKRLARNYARLADNFLLKDREPENSIILFSVQLLTVPTVSDLLVNEYYFFGLICSTLTAFFLTDHLYLLLPSGRAELPSRINCESRAFRTRRYFNAFHDLRYIMNVDMIKRVLAEDPLYLRQYLDLISLFQGMNAQVCQKDTHVEYESEIWVNAFNVTLQIAKCCRQFADCFAMLPSSTPRQGVATTKTLIRAINRVLKKIEEWGSEPEDETEINDASAKRAQTSITGVGVQVYSPVPFPYIGSLAIIRYDVASEPVSFHHPLHWLLAGLLEYASLLDNDVLREAGWPGGFRQAITLYKSTDGEDVSPDILLPILDFPIRTIVFSSQIRAGVWAHHYRDISLRENTYDADVFLLQLGFVTVEPNRFLATLMTRFDLVPWFLGDIKHEQYDSSQTVFMAEELLNLLIVCACERANVTGLSVQHKIRREIIHNLCLGHAAYSELTKRIPERLTEHADFDRILSEVANFKAPDSVNDHGLYDLKDEFYSCIDTYFWHYSRNNREEAENVLKSRWKKANPTQNEEDFFVIPKSSKILTGPFEFLGEFLHCQLFIQMVIYALWNVRVGENHKSDTILDQTLHLIMLALIDENHHARQGTATDQGGFYHYACETYYPLASCNRSQDLSLFEVMTIFRDDEKYTEVHKRFDYIFDKLEEGHVERTSQTVKIWKASRALRLQQEAEESNGSVELSEYEKKKQAAKERQMKIMAQFAQAQSQFMEQNEGLYDDDEEDALAESNETEKEDMDDSSSAGDIHGFCAYPTGTCIVCQEDVNERSLPYGLLGLLQTSNILRETPMDDCTIMTDIMNMGANLDVEWQDKQILGDGAASVRGFPAHLHKTGLYASTCGHLMHIKCFEVYCTSIESRHSAQLTRNHPENRTRKEFMCPLCKSLGNALLPVFWKGKKESFPGVLAKGDEAAYQKFLQSGARMVTEKMKQTLGPTRPAFGPRRRSSGVSKLKEAVATWAPSLWATPGGQSILHEEWINRRAPVTSGATLQEPHTVDHSTQDKSASAQIGRLGPFDAETLHATALSYIPSIKKIYSRQYDVLSIIFQEICSDESACDMSAMAKNVDLLWGLLGYTITSVEIAARGTGRSGRDNVDTTTTGTLFDQIPSQTQMLLRILSDTMMAYTSIMCQQDSTVPTSSATSNPTLMRIHLLALGRLRQIFVDTHIEDVTHLIGSGHEKMVVYDNSPLLEDDPFMILVELSLHMIPFTKADIHPFVRILLMAELTKVTAGLLQDRLMNMRDSIAVTESGNNGKTPQDRHQQEVSAARTFAFFVMDKLEFSGEEAVEAFDKLGDEAFCTLLKAFALPFVRRTLVLMITRFGLIITPPADDASSVSDASELDRLLELLRLPSFSELLQQRSAEQDQLMSDWCRQHVKESQRRLQLEGSTTPFSSTQLINIPLDLPTPFYLVALPHRLDQLFDESMRRVCHKCNTVPTDPAMCLFCGTFVCCQSFCCSEDEEGECNLHTLGCGGEIGVFISVKRCVLILLHNGNGWFINAPYLDSHGEIDQGLRRGKPQYLNPKRYAEIRKLWLQHNIPIYVARQIEANYDIGGWTTL
ncbi:hypothetical protein DFQ28_000812 [Apophysomyces sp. BC1034]|nr:hypothetical protein DFQ30_000794 [Apophysomyces sp. BC1015]KAG0177579.1 hypothetical protein DFQ29_004677 [Apophysomyces sp. BC1021]KAG0191158.1 hypothetical protein DFQ28_000812 [Apophysomyces sp. BC1034]